MRKLVRTRSEEILLVEHRRAHNICIELAGIRLPFPATKVLPRAELSHSICRAIHHPRNAQNQVAVASTLTTIVPPGLKLRRDKS